ncbi:MAG: acyltransferase [Candidatus Binataceae bacterium]|nr:acyltransferase [Candidatus Binataceae bacterium]
MFGLVARSRNMDKNFPLDVNQITPDAAYGLESHNKPAFKESIGRALKNRILQSLARSMPGATGFRIWAHRQRGVKIGERVHIASDVMMETAYPQWISIGNDVQVGIRCLIIAHIHSLLPHEEDLSNYVSVKIEDEVYLGAGSIILPNVTIGRGAVITAGSVVTRSIPAMTMVQGNPAKAVARCGIPLLWDTPIKKFYLNLKPIPRAARDTDR